MQHILEKEIELHNIISEGVHKVEDIEENVNSLFLALMNPEDRENITGTQSFSDRIINIKKENQFLEIAASLILIKSKSSFSLGVVS